MSPHHEPPGLARQQALRTVFRVLSICFPIGLLMVGYGFYTFATTDPGFEPGLPSGMGMFIAGGLLMVFGFFCLNAGFMGGAARYSAGETMPVVKDSASFLTDGEGVAGIGRTVDDARPRTPSSPAGPYCRACGVRNDEDATFCDGCGASLA